MVGPAGRKRAVVIAACAAAVLVLALGVGATLSGDARSDVLRKNRALNFAEMHMQSLRDGDYEGSVIKFPPDIDFDDLAMGQQIPCYVYFDKGLIKSETVCYPIYSGDRVVAAFGVFKVQSGEVGGDTAMGTEGIGEIDDCLREYGTCALLTTSSGDFVVGPGRHVQAVDPNDGLAVDRRAPRESALPPRTKDVPGEVLDQIEFPPHEDPVPFKLNEPPSARA